MSFLSFWTAITGGIIAVETSGKNEAALMLGVIAGQATGQFLEYLLENRVNPEVKHFINTWAIAGTFGYLAYYGIGDLGLAACAVLLTVELINNTIAPPRPGMR